MPTIYRRRLSCGCVVNEHGFVMSRCGQRGHRVAIKHPSGLDAGGDYARRRGQHPPNSQRPKGVT